MASRRNPVYFIWLSFMAVVVAMTASQFFLACGGGDDDDDDATATPSFTSTATFTPTPTATPTPTQIPMDTYFPAYTGNIWYYFVSGIDNTGAGQAEVLPVEVYNGYYSTPIQISSDDVPELVSALLYLFANNARIDLLGGAAADEDLSLNNPLNLVNFPLALGNLWESTSSLTFSGVDVDIYAITSVDGYETVTVQGMTFTDCYRINTTVTASAVIIFPIEIQVPATIWMAPNVGIVKATATIPEIPFLPDFPSGQLTLELTGTNF